MCARREGGGEKNTMLRGVMRSVDVAKACVLTLSYKDPLIRSVMRAATWGVM
jgi:hypothetical protein